MTLGLGILTRKFCCVVSDRRTSAGGKVDDDEFDKTCTLITRDARVALSFTGLAKHKRYHSKVRLIQYLKAAAAPDFLLPAIMVRLCAIFSRDFLQDPNIRGIADEDRRFSLMVMGYRYDRDENSTPCFGMISNFQDLETGLAADKAWPEFRPFLFPFPDGFDCEGMMIGFTGALDISKMEYLGKRAQDLCFQAVVGRLVNLVQDASRLSDVIGGQVTSIVIPQGWRTNIDRGYHVSTPQKTIYLPAHVVAHPTKLWDVTASTVTADGSIYLAVPVVSGNRQCPCMSGLKYKVCHRPRRSTRVDFGGPTGIRDFSLTDKRFELVGDLTALEKQDGSYHSTQRFQRRRTTPVLSGSDAKSSE
jgi:SEC-C motif